jgi:hypothetical protein
MRVYHAQAGKVNTQRRQRRRLHAGFDSPRSICYTNLV